MIGTDVEKEGTRFDTNIKDTTQTVIGEQPDCPRRTVSTSSLGVALWEDRFHFLPHTALRHTHLAD